MEDIIKAMNLTFRLVTDFGIKFVRPDIAVLTLANHMVGVIEIKKPGLQAESILLSPTVVGELFDQMMLVEGFYMSGPVCGILTTGMEWMVCWFAEDDSIFGASFDFVRSDGTDRTPTKPRDSAADSTPGTPSQTRGDWGRELTTPSSESGVDPVSEPRSFKRVLHATSIIRSVGNSDALLQLMYTALARMSTVHLSHRPGVPSCLFLFLKNSNSVSWSPEGYDAARLRLSEVENAFPLRSTTRLVALEDLGRGSSGKAWLACTNSPKNASLCVLKFSNRADEAGALERECGHWIYIYPEFADMVRVEKWSGSPALLMPHFAVIHDEFREGMKEEVAKLLQRFVDSGFVHTDVNWRNLGYYMKEGDKVPVLFDLDGAQNIENAGKSFDVSDWIASSMLTLFPL